MLHSLHRVESVVQFDQLFPGPVHYVGAAVLVCEHVSDGLGLQHLGQEQIPCGGVGVECCDSELGIVLAPSRVRGRQAIAVRLEHD